MISSLFSGMPTPVRVGAMVLGGGSIIGGLMMIFPGAWWIILIGTILVAVLVGAWVWFLKWRSKRKAKPFEQSLGQNAATTPGHVSEAVQRARLDDLRKTFEDGIAKFRTAGKNIYSLPWYLLIGEIGSGKTEAIRHCNVGFPPGLQDPLQGTGGTINMHWWFTNHAVVLDTAGRMVFGEDGAGESNEWPQFLRMLRQNRPNCPINGLLLVIPADSLIKDTADQIEHKAGKIAAQFDQIQRELGVRFPVFVKITKCDLINGFREFFDELNDPQLQHQIMGWSNPADLDDPFEPDLVDQHLKDVSATLKRRRLTLLLDPVHTENPNQPRIDQVDALYDFPDAITRIAPRLRQYLRMIFVAGEWSNKPLFLRGIYFTSSMREGAALDEDLAGALGISVDQLPEGQAWERDRAYFLRDLFMNKIFKEKGLVTRATNTAGLLRRRKGLIFGSLIVGLLLLIGISWFGAATIKDSIGDQFDFWADVRDQMESDGGAEQLNIISLGKGGAYTFETSTDSRGFPEAKSDAKEISVIGVHEATREKAEEQMDVPLIFQPVAWSSNLLAAERRKAHAAVFEASVVRNVVGTVLYRKTLKNVSTSQWNERATDVLRQLILLEAHAAGRPLPDSNTLLMDLSAFVNYLIPKPKEDRARLVKEYTEKLQATLEWTYRDGGGQAWPPVSLGMGTEDRSQPAIRGAVQKFITSVVSPDSVSGRVEARLKAVELALSAFADAEKKLQSVAEPYIQDDKWPVTTVGYMPLKTKWTQEMVALKSARDQLKTAWNELAKASGTDVASISIDDMIAAAEDIALDGPESAFDSLIEATDLQGVESEEASFVSDIRTVLTERRDGSLAKRKSTLANIFKVFRSAKGAYLKLRMNERDFDARFTLYESVDQLVQAKLEKDASVFRLGALLKKVDTDVSGTLAKITEKSTLFENVVKVCEGMTQTAGRSIRKAVADAVLNQIQDSDNGTMVAARIGALVDGQDALKPLEARAIGMTTGFKEDGVYDTKYHPGATKTYLELFDAVRNVSGSEGPARVLDRGEISAKATLKARAVDGYVKLYMAYWSRTVPGKTQADRFTDWEKCYDAVDGLRLRRKFEEIAKVLKQASDALGELPASWRPKDAATWMKAVNRVKRQWEECNSKAFRDDCGEAHDAWRDLGRVPHLAWQKLSGLKSSQVRSKFLDSYYESEDGGVEGVEFWNSLTLQIVDVLARTAGQTAQKNINLLVKDYRRFPLYVEKGAPLLAAKGKAEADVSMEKAVELVRQVPSAIRKDIVSTPETTIGEGGDLGTRYPQFNETLKKARSDSAGNQAFMNRIRPIVNVFSDPKNPLTCTIEFLNEDEAGVKVPEKPDALSQLGRADRIADSFKFTKIGSGVAGAARGLYDKNARKLKMEIPKDGGVNIEFVATNGKKESEVVVKSDWSVMSLLHDYYTMRSADGKTFQVLLTVPMTVNQQKTNRYYWMQLKFNHSLPELKEWSTKESWPKP